MILVNEIHIYPSNTDSSGKIYRVADLFEQFSYINFKKKGLHSKKGKLDIMYAENGDPWMKSNFSLINLTFCPQNLLNIPYNHFLCLNYLEVASVEDCEKVITT